MCALAPLYFCGNHRGALAVVECGVKQVGHLKKCMELVGVGMAPNIVSSTVAGKGSTIL